jgi:lipoate-protein ligase A
MTVVGTEWRLIRERARPGPLNMALDEVATETAADEAVRTAKVYSLGPSTLSLGYHQDPDTIDWDFYKREGVTVTRRPTGGGAIYHDAIGDIPYSIVAPADELPSDLMDTYELLCLRTTLPTAHGHLRTDGRRRVLRRDRTACDSRAGLLSQKAPSRTRCTTG